MLGGMQFGVLVEVLLCEIDGRVLGGMQFGVLVEVLFCELDGWAVGGSKWRCSWMSRHSVCGAGAGARVLFDRGAGDGAGACADGCCFGYCIAGGA